MSDHLEDLVDYSLDDNEDQANDHEMASVSNAAEQVVDPDEEPVALPTASELRLSQRVLELERERDALAARVQDFEQQYPSHSTTIPAPAPQIQDHILVPPALLPVLSLLQRHIHDLTRDNAALRYTLLGTRHDTASLSRMPLDSISPVSSMTTTPVQVEAALDVSDESVDLAAVVERVKTLMAENDELGDMVAEAGSVDGAEWLKAWDDSKAVIASLESDLDMNVAVVEGLRGELESYKQRYGSLSSRENGKGDRDRQDRSDRGDRQDRGDRNKGNGRRSSGGTRRDEWRDDSRQRDNRDNNNRDRGPRKETAKPGQGQGGQREGKPGMSIMGRAETARREEDRASKRRR